MRNLMLTLLLVPLMLFLAPVDRAVAAYTLPSGASIDGDRQVYMAWHGNNWEIFMRDITSGAITSITNEPHMQGFPGIWDKYIVWQDNRDNTDSQSGDFSIYLYNIETKNSQRISPATKGSHEEPIINGGKVIWTSLGFYGKEVYLYDISSGDTKSLTTTGHNIAGLKFSGQIVAWLDLMNSTNDLNVFNTDSGQETQLTSGKDVNLLIAVNGARVTWSEKSGENCQIKLFDASSNKTLILTSGEGSYIPVSMSDSYLLASHNGQYNLIELATGRETSINPALANPDQVLFNDNRIIWIKGSKVAIESVPAVSPSKDSTISHDSQPKFLIKNQKIEEHVTMKNGIALVPLRDIFQALGAKINWDGKTQTVIASKGSITLKLQMGSKTAYRNSKPLTLPIPGQVVNGKTMVPLCFVSEALGAKVNWDDATQTFTVDSEAASRSLYGYTEDQIRRALAYGAVYKKVSDLPYDLFLLWDQVPKSKANNIYIEKDKQVLYKAWGVNNREDALRMLKWLQDEGHRKSFDEMVHFVKLATEKDYQIFYYENKDNPRYVYALNFVRDHIDEIPEMGILAWDYCRLVNLASEFYIIGYITKKEAIDQIIYAAKILQDTDSSWDQMAQSHLLGRGFWGMDNEGTERFYKPAVKWLLTNDESPWVKYDWDYVIE